MSLIKNAGSEVGKSDVPGKDDKRPVVPAGSIPGETVDFVQDRVHNFRRRSLSMISNRILKPGLTEERALAVMCFSDSIIDLLQPTVTDICVDVILKGWEVAMNS
jgi:hypothetical protein